ncbi:MAG: hypothetical protein ACLRIL_08370 [Fusicatenibacter saccharivorans]
MEQPMRVGCSICVWGGGSDLAPAAVACRTERARWYRRADDDVWEAVD